MRPTSMTPKSRLKNTTDALRVLSEMGHAAEFARSGNGTIQISEVQLRDWRRRLTKAPPVRPGDAPQTPACEGTCNAFLAPCGAAFCTYEEMAQHACHPA